MNVSYFIRYILAVNCDRKHLENSKIDWKTPGFFPPKEWEPYLSDVHCMKLLQ